MNNYIPVIGLEIHVELKTDAKMFCGCPADWFGKPPNSQTCPVCLGLPGALPVPNKKAVEWTVLIAKALNCKINKNSKFDRKHYFYPDLPKGYQISQFDMPIAQTGNFQFSIFNFQFKKNIRIRRVHLEEDTGKLTHRDADTLVDFNRSGVPLVEIVTEPDFDNSDDVKRFLEELQTILRYLEVSDCDMEKGSMRLEPNISVQKVQSSKFKVQSKTPKYKVEVKNINSFRFVKKAIEYEVKRQIEFFESGKIPIQETRGYDSGRGITFFQRTKEESHDYRYFPEPDIPPLNFDEKFLTEIKVPELPSVKLERYVQKFGIKYEDAFILTREKKKADFFERVVGGLGEEGGKIANFIINRKISVELPIDEFIKRAKEMLIPKKTDQNELEAAVKKIIKENQDAVNQYKEGKENVIMYLVGQVMKEMRGQADAELVKSRLIRQLAEKS